MPRAPRTFSVSHATVYADIIKRVMHRPGSQLRVQVYATAPTKADAAAIIKATGAAEGHPDALRVAQGTTVDALTDADLIKPGRVIIARDGGGDLPLFIIDPGAAPIAAGYLTHGRELGTYRFVPRLAALAPLGSIAADPDVAAIKTVRGWKNTNDAVLLSDRHVQARIDTGSMALVRIGRG